MTTNSCLKNPTR